MKDLDEYIVETQSVLLPLITKPKCTSKLLAKPPFRFIHDIVMALIQATGFPQNYFKDNELDSSLLTEKASKIEFLDKLICLVGQYYSDVLDVKSSKIVAGLEPEKTNSLLARLGQVASNKNADHASVIQRCIKTFSNGKSPHETSAVIEAPEVSLNEKPVDVNQRFGPEDQDIHSSITRCNSDINQTQTMLMSVISKPQCTEKLLARPPFRFLYDVVLAVDEATDIGLRNVMCSSEFDDSYFNEKSTKIAFLDKVIALIESILEVKIEANPKKIVAGMEAEKTCYFLQLVIVASSVRRRNKKVEDEGSKRVDSEIKVDNHFDILNDAHDLSKMLGEIPQEINVPSGNDAQETNKDENCEHPAELEDLNDFKKVPSDAMNPNQDSDSPFPLSLVYEHGVNIESSSGTSIFDNRDYGPVTSRTIDRSIENIVQSATKMSTIIMGLKTIWSKMQKEKEVWKEQKAQIMRELEKHQVKRSKDPIKIRIQELDCEIAEAKRLMDSMKNSVRCP